MKMMGRKSKGLLFSMGMYAVILTEAAACQCLAEDIPADIPNVKIEYVPLRAADHIEMVQRIHATDNEQAAESGLLFSKEDTEALQRIAMAEAGNQGPDGMWMVMSVVLNRVESEDFPNTIIDTQNKEELHRLFFDLRDQLGQTFIIVTHDETLAATTDRTIRLRDGKVVMQND